MIGPTWLWVALIILLPGIGAVIWLVVSRTAEASPEEPRPATPRAPDDDPDFLRYLQQRNKRDEDGQPRGDSGDEG